MSKSRNILSPRRYWKEVEVVMLKEHFADTPTEVLSQFYGRPTTAVLSKAHALGLHKSRELLARMAREATADPSHPSHKHRFQKGIVPANKGLRRPGWSAGNMKATQFAKGNKPHTWVPVGSLRINSEGVLDRKLNDLPGPSKVRWFPVYRLVWEAAHGPVPAGHVVAFKPGRRTTVESEITLDAVELLTRAQIMARNTIHNLPRELASLMQLRGALNRQINKLRKQV